MIKPHEIEPESMRIIRSELGEHRFSERQLKVVLRVIHATADFEFAERLHFTAQAVEQGVALLRSGCSIVTDVHMVEAGINHRLLGQFGGSTHCLIDQPDIEKLAREQEMTRAAAAVQSLAHVIDGGIVAIGNAPTALRQVLHMAAEGQTRPGLVVGVPVGFVNALESKDELWASQLPCITALGRKGGSPVAAAIVNALLHLASEEGGVG